MHVRLIRRGNLEVVGPGTAVRVTGVAATLGDDRVVRAREREDTSAGERAGVGLQLQMALVHEPVADVDDEDQHDDEHRDAQEPDRDDDEHAAVLFASPSRGFAEPSHEQPAP